MDPVLIKRSLERSKLDMTKVPSFERLVFFSRRSPKAQTILTNLQKKSVEYISYVKHMADAVASAHRTGCSCDWCKFVAKCQAYLQKIWRLANALRKTLRRPNLFRGVPVDVVARKIVITSVPA